MSRQHGLPREKSFWIIIGALLLWTVITVTASACSSEQSEETESVAQITTIEADPGFWTCQDDPEYIDNGLGTCNAGADTVYMLNPNEVSSETFISIAADTCSTNGEDTYGEWMQIRCTKGQPPDTFFYDEF